MTTFDALGLLVRSQYSELALEPDANLAIILHRPAEREKIRFSFAMIEGLDPGGGGPERERIPTTKASPPSRLEQRPASRMAVLSQSLAVIGGVSLMGVIFWLGIARIALLIYDVLHGSVR